MYSLKCRKEKSLKKPVYIWKNIKNQKNKKSKKLFLLTGQKKIM